MTRLLNDRNQNLIVALGIPMLALTITRPLGFDNAMYQTMALDILRYGRIPYIGTWDQNFPGIVYIHYLAILLFGSSDFSIRFFDVTVQLLFAIYLYRFWSRWLRPQTAALASILYIAYYVSGGGLLLAERDVYVGMLIVVSFDFILRARETQKFQSVFILLAGLVQGLNLVLRPTAAVPIAILAAGIGLTREGKFAFGTWPRVLLFLVASSVPLAIILAYYAGITGGLEEFYLATIRWNLDLYVKGDSGLLRLGLQFIRRAFLVPFTIYGLFKWRNVAVFFGHLATRWEKLIYASLAISALLIALIMRKYFDYHFAPFYLLLMPLAALGIEQFASRFRRPLQHHYAVVLAVYAATFLAYVPRGPLAYGLAMTIRQNPVDLSYEAQYPNPYWGAKAEWAVERYLNAPANHAGRVEICSFTTNLQLHLGREAAGRYIQLLALAYRTSFEEAGPPHYTEYQMRWQRDYIDSLSTLKPRFIVLARNTHFIYFDDVYGDFLRYLPGFDSLLATCYRYDTSFGGYQIFRIRTDSSIRKVPSVNAAEAVRGIKGQEQ